MRLPGIVIGFSLGAFMMWRLGVPDLAPRDCVSGSDCVPAARAVASTQERPAAPGLRIVVYDPGAETEPQRASPTVAMARTSPETPVSAPALGPRRSPGPQAVRDRWRQGTRLCDVR